MHVKVEIWAIECLEYILIFITLVFDFDKPGNLKVDTALRMDWEFAVGRSRLLHLEWINNKS